MPVTVPFGMKRRVREMPVLGVGGLFFRAKDPEALSAWYRDQLGVGPGCGAEPGEEPNEWVWMTRGGPVVFSPFKADTDYFAADKAFMINLRVSDLDGLLARLRAAGIEIITKAEWDEGGLGRFARIHDPEGNAIELWEPPAPKSE
jgi:predicted enzyme related to lactoylglutathione lyase